MDLSDSSRDFEETRLLYRCSCGVQLVIDQHAGGKCDHCGRFITTEKLELELSATMALPDDATMHGQSETVCTDDSFDVVGVDPLIGQSFEHFEIVNRLGRGGMGYVYRALDKSLQRYVAVKVLRSGVSWTDQRSSDREVEVLLQEAVSQARVSHPNVVTIYFVGRKAGEPFLAMELVKGTPLSQLIVDQTLSYRQLVSYGLQVSRALQFSHRLDIIHGDIKPSNLLVQENGTVKLSDFGMARRESQSDAVAFGGTPSYLAPELIEGAKTSVASDIYALGVTLYEMTFGHLPLKLKGKKPADWTKEHNARSISYPNPWPEHLPEKWHTILQRMLAKDQDKRYQNYDDLVADLENVEALSSIRAKTVPRLLAGLIDFTSVLLVAASIQFLLFDVLKLRDQTDNLAIVLLVSLADMLPLFFFSLSVFLFRQSIGRNLLYLRVVNRYGLKPTARVMLTRSFVRMGFVWLLVSSMVFDVEGFGWPQTVRTLLAGTAIALLLTQITVLTFSKKNRTLQDWIYKTDVVLDT